MGAGRRCLEVLLYSNGQRQAVGIVRPRVGHEVIAHFSLHRHGVARKELGSAEDFDCLQDILDNGTGAARQALVYEANHDLREVVREIVEASVPEAAETLGD